MTPQTLWMDKRFFERPCSKAFFCFTVSPSSLESSSSSKKGVDSTLSSPKTTSRHHHESEKNALKNISIRRRGTIENYKSFKKKMRQSSKFSWIATAVWRSHLDKAQITIISELACCCAALLLIWIFASFESRKVGSSRKKYFLCTLSCLLLDSRRKWLLLPPTPLQKYAPQSPFVRPQQT